MKEVAKKLVGRKSGYWIYSVSAFAVRNIEEDDEEFGMYATYLDMPSLVPRGEIWLAEEGQAEWPIFIAGALRWLETGSYDEAVGEERRQRGGCAGEIDDTIYLHYFREVRDGKHNYNVWFVDGKLVRDRFKTDFVEGGHPYVYPWIPRGEVWLADAKAEELPFLLIHELTELRLMRDKTMSYLDAHEKANDAERKARKEYQGVR